MALETPKSDIVDSDEFVLKLERCPLCKKGFLRGKVGKWKGVVCDWCGKVWESEDRTLRGITNLCGFDEFVEIKSWRDYSKNFEEELVNFQNKTRA